MFKSTSSRSSAHRSIKRRPVIQGLAPGLTYTLGIDTVNVFLSGPVPKLDDLKADAVPVILDLTGLGPGVHAIEPKVPTPEGIKVEGLSPQTIEIIIGAPLTSTPSPADALRPLGSGTTAGEASRPTATPGTIRRYALRYLDAQTNRCFGRPT